MFTHVLATGQMLLCKTGESRHRRIMDYNSFGKITRQTNRKQQDCELNFFTVNRSSVFVTVFNLMGLYSVILVILELVLLDRRWITLLNKDVGFEKW